MNEKKNNLTKATLYFNDKDIKIQIGWDIFKNNIIFRCTAHKNFVTTQPSTILFLNDESLFFNSNTSNFRSYHTKMAKCWQFAT